MSTQQDYEQRFADLEERLRRLEEGEPVLPEPGHNSRSSHASAQAQHDENTYHQFIANLSKLEVNMPDYREADSFRTVLALARAIRNRSDGDIEAILGPMKADELKAALYSVCELIASDSTKAFNLKLDAFFKAVNDAECGVY